MTFDDDFIRVHLMLGTQDWFLKNVGLEWPPPEKLMFDKDQLREPTELDPLNHVLIRCHMSSITDQQRVQRAHGWRGAEYYYHDELPGGAA